ncbi:MAG: hypothetical protein ACLT1A_11740 [Dysosmobacter sp.]
MTHFTNRAVLAEIKEIRETTDVAEAVKLLSSGNWIAILTTSETQPCLFCLGRVSGDPF